MKRFIFLVLFLGIALSSYGQVAGATVKGQKPDGSFDFLQLDADKKLITSGSSTGGGAGTYTLVLPAIASSTTRYVLLATGTRTLLSEIASFTDGDMVMFQMSNSGYWNFGDITAASMKAGYGIYFEGLGDPQWFNLRSGMDMSFAGNTAISTITVNIVKQQ